MIVHKHVLLLLFTLIQFEVTALKWMVRRQIKYLGQEEAVKLMMWNNNDPHFSLRANRGKCFTCSELVSRLEKLESVIQDGLLKEGLFCVQDESAGLVVSIVNLQPAETIIDCCDAPGGKTLFMAACLNDEGMVTAININQGRFKILKDERPLDNKEMNAIIGAWFTLWRD